MEQIERNKHYNKSSQQNQNQSPTEYPNCEVSHPSIEFFSMFRKTGFYDTIRLLSLLPDEKAPQNELSQSAESRGISRNSLDRCRPYLLKYNLIRYELSSEGRKVLALTEKGRIVLAKIDEINGMLAKKNKRTKNLERKGENHRIKDARREREVEKKSDG